MPFKGSSDFEDLLKSIESSQIQHFDLEYLIGIDGSMDIGKYQILKKLPIRLEIYDFPESPGISKILNKLISICKSDYIVRMDSDDLMMPGRVSMQLEFMESFPNFTVHCGNAINQNGILLKSDKSRRIKCSEFLSINPIIHPAVMLRRKDLLNGNTYYDERWKRSQDYELWTRVVRKHEIYFDSEPIIIYLSKFKTKNYMRQHLFFSIANVKNLIWHLFHRCKDCSSIEVAIAFLRIPRTQIYFLKTLVKSFSK